MLKRTLNVLGSLFLMLSGGAAVVGAQATCLFPSFVSPDDAIKANIALNPIFCQPGFVYVITFVALFALSAIMWRAAERITA